MSSLPEVAGDAALLVDPTDVAEIAEGLARLLTEPALAEDLRQRGLQRAATFTWAATARATLDVYRHADGSVVVKVSLISTVKDASAHIEEFLGSVAAQTRRRTRSSSSTAAPPTGRASCCARGGRASP